MDRRFSSTAEPGYKLHRDEEIGIDDLQARLVYLLVQAKGTQRSDTTR